MNQQLLDYIKSHLAQGTNQETIKQNLLSSGGWNSIDIDEAFKVVAPVPNSNAQNPASAMPVPPYKVCRFLDTVCSVYVRRFNSYNSSRYHTNYCGCYFCSVRFCRKCTNNQFNNLYRYKLVVLCLYDVLQRRNFRQNDCRIAS